MRTVIFDAPNNRHFNTVVKITFKNENNKMVCSECKQKGHTSSTCLSKYPTVSREDRPGECSICLTSTNKPKCITNCGHLFHISCLKKWLKVNHTCPICRNPLVDKHENITDIIIRTIMMGDFGLSNDEFLAIFESDFLT